MSAVGAALGGPRLLGTLGGSWQGKWGPGGDTPGDGSAGRDTSGTMAGGPDPGRSNGRTGLGKNFCGRRDGFCAAEKSLLGCHCEDGGARAASLSPTVALCFRALGAGARNTWGLHTSLSCAGSGFLEAEVRPVHSNFLACLLCRIQTEPVRFGGTEEKHNLLDPPTGSLS